jgi:hypothetical protein
MPKRSRRSSPKPGRGPQGGVRADDGPRPEMILDFEFEDGAFFIVLRNIGSRPACRVRTVLEPQIRGLGGDLDVASLPLLREIPFFAPGKQVRFLLDSSALYFSRGEPTRLTAHITCTDDRGREFETVIQHDLEIYRSLAYRVRSANAG